MDKRLDTAKYRTLLCRLAAKADRSDFTDLFKQVLVSANVPRNLHFVLKMELKRLQKPCMRQIDLRGSVDGDCYPFVFEGMTHYLDDIAKSVFNDQCSNFGGFTIGVYECVHNTPNNFRVMHQRNKTGGVKEEKPAPLNNESNYRVPSLTFNNFHTRKEERMHFVSDVSMVKESELVLIGNTVDISVSGCQLKATKNKNFKVNQVLQLRFNKFEEEFELGLTKELDYKVVAIDTRDSDFDLLRLSRISCNETKDFDEFLRNFIKGNKRRYKINLNNSIQSVLNRGYAQYSMPRRSDLNIFLRGTSLNLEPFMAVVTEMNRGIVEYWQDASKKLFVGHALTAERLSRLHAKLKNRDSDSYLYTFHGVGKNNEKVFYAALKDELEEQPELKKLFLSLGTKHYDFRVFNITLSASSEEYAYQPFSLLNDNIEVFRKLNKKPSPRVMHKLKGLSHVLSLRDITTDLNRQEYEFADADHSLLDGVKKLKVEPVHRRPLQIVPVKVVDLRREERYHFSTSVTVSFANQRVEGQSIDLSTKGMKLRFEGPVQVFTKTDVRVDFPEFKLSKLKYRIVSVNDAKTEVCLALAGDVREHRGRLFIKELINKNKNFLIDYQTNYQDAELSWCVQNILSSSSTTFSAFITRVGRRFRPAIATPGNFKCDFLTRISNSSSIDLGFLFTSEQYSKFIEAGLGQRHFVNASNQHDIYISMVGEKIAVKLDTEFHTVNEKVEFVENAQSKGQFYCLSGCLSKAGRPDLTRVNVELNYISLYSMHKAKQIEEELWSVCGVLEFKDITEEVISRLQSHSTNVPVVQAA